MASRNNGFSCFDDCGKTGEQQGVLFARSTAASGVGNVITLNTGPKISSYTTQF